MQCFRVRDEIFSYRVSEGISLSKQTYLVPEHDEKGRAFVEFEVFLIQNCQENVSR